MDELTLSIWRLCRLGVLGTKPLPLNLPLSSDHDWEPRSVPPSETDSTVESCELHWCGCSFMCRNGYTVNESAHEPTTFGLVGTLGKFIIEPLPPTAWAASFWLRTVDIEFKEPVRNDSLDLDL